MLQVRKAHEVTFLVSMLKIHTFFNNIYSLYETNRKILLQTASNQRVFELIFDLRERRKTVFIVLSCFAGRRTRHKKFRPAQYVLEDDLCKKKHSIHFPEEAK